MAANNNMICFVDTLRCKNLFEIQQVKTTCLLSCSCMNEYQTTNEDVVTHSECIFCNNIGVLCMIAHNNNMMTYEKIRKKLLESRLKMHNHSYIYHDWMHKLANMAVFTCQKLLLSTTYLKIKSFWILRAFFLHAKGELKSLSESQDIDVFVKENKNGVTIT
ncbi:Hypothetical predicted protein, partial [Mytilus galloprovincialis]